MVYSGWLVVTRISDRMPMLFSACQDYYYDESARGLLSLSLRGQGCHLVSLYSFVGMSDQIGG